MDYRELEKQSAEALRCYGWGSPVGLGLLASLVALSLAVLRIAFR